MTSNASNSSQSQRPRTPPPSPKQHSSRKFSNVGITTGYGNLQDESSSTSTVTTNTLQLPRRRRLTSSVVEMKIAAGKELKEQTMNMTQPNIQIPFPLPPPVSLPPSRQSMTHADILNFVAKQHSKSIAFKELLLHLTFMAIFLTIVALHRAVFQGYLMNQSLTAAFVTQQIDPNLQPVPKALLDVGQPEELRDYLISVVAGTLDAYADYTGVPKTPMERNYIMLNNRLIGGIRFRQLRAAPNKGCKNPAELRGISPPCHLVGYSNANMDTNPFGPPSNRNKYQYQTASQTGNKFMYSNILYGLDGGGYVVDMPLGSNFTDLVNELISDGWYDTATRAIIVTMNFLSVDLGSMVSVMQLIFETPGSGEVYPSASFKTFRLELYEMGTDWFRLILEILFLLILFYMVIREVVEVKVCYHSKRGLRSYFRSGWNWNELISIFLSTSGIAQYLDYLLAAQRHADLALVEYTPSLDQIGSKAHYYYNITYFCILFITFQTFKYLRMNRRLYMMWKTLQRAGTDLFGFLFIFLIFVFGFVFAAWMAFGADLPYFSTFSLSFGTSWNFMIGNPPDYQSLVFSTPVFGPIFFALFTVFVFFILANVFIAIVGKSFGEISKSVSDQVKLVDAIESKIISCFKSTKKFARKFMKRSSTSKRTILEILDGLINPEILEQPNLSMDDVYKACGPSATEAEARDLFEWIERLESKKRMMMKRATFEEETDSGDEDNSFDGAEMKAVKTSEYLELQDSLDSLRDDMQRLTQLFLSMQKNSTTTTTTTTANIPPSVNREPISINREPSSILKPARVAFNVYAESLSDDLSPPPPPRKLHPLPPPSPLALSNPPHISITVAKDDSTMTISPSISPATSLDLRRLPTVVEEPTKSIRNVSPLPSPRQAQDQQPSPPSTDNKTLQPLPLRTSTQHSSSDQHPLRPLRTSKDHNLFNNSNNNNNNNNNSNNNNNNSNSNSNKYINSRSSSTGSLPSVQHPSHERRLTSHSRENHDSRPLRTSSSAASSHQHSHGHSHSHNHGHGHGHGFHHLLHHTTTPRPDVAPLLDESNQSETSSKDEDEDDEMESPSP